MLKQQGDERFEKLFTPAEAWTALHISRPSFYRHVQDGRLPVVRMGGKLLVRETTLREAIQHGISLEKAAADMAPALHPQWSGESA
jgi:excisionase family DNA binding protein